MMHSVDAIWDVLRTQAELDSLFRIVCGKTNHHWDALRKIHALIDASDFGDDPYPVDWTRIFTPIEEKAWSAFRFYGIPMRPQYPIDRFFTDFANPRHKFIVECDGKDWHDPAKDLLRDLKCESLGWTVYRVTGSQCNRSRLSPWEMYVDRDELEENIDECRFWLNGTSDGLIFSLAQRYCPRRRSIFPFDQTEISERLMEASGAFHG